MAHRNRITEVFIAKSRGYDDTEDAGDLVKDIRTLSNYIIFLLVDRPYMLPGSQHLTEMWDRSREHQKGAVFAKLKAFFSLHDDPNSAGSQHVENLAKFLFTEKPKPILAVPRLYFPIVLLKSYLTGWRRKEGWPCCNYSLMCGWIFLCMGPIDAAGSPMPRSSAMVVS